MSIVITADSVIDWNEELYKTYPTPILPLSVSLNGNIYRDGVDVTPKDIYASVQATKKLPKTSANGIEEFRTFFKQFTDKGDQVIHISLSSELSSSYEHAVAGSEGLDVEVVDTMSLSSGSGLLCIYAHQLKEKGIYDYKQIAELVRKRIYAVQASFCIDELDYLHKGGRCSSLQLLGANLLRIKPSIELHNGKMSMAKKYRGKFSVVLEKYVNDILAMYNDPDYTQVFITRTMDTPEEYVEYAKRILTESTRFEHIYCTYAGCTITSHCGPNTLGILYFNDGSQINK